MGLTQKSSFGILCLIAFLAAGCGLSQYEEGMKQQQGLLKKSQEEEDLLGPPVEMFKPPQGSQEKGPADREFFFRPPKGISKKRNDDPNHQFLLNANDSKTDMACYEFDREPKVEKKECPFRAVLILSD